MVNDVNIIEIDDEKYPVLLKSLDKKAPARLYCIGNTDLLNKRCVSVVGSRKTSNYGKWVASNIGKRLAENDIVTVSGMALGCDSEAHRGALDAGGETIAVLGCGIDVCYPKSNRMLRDRIISERGLIISEYPSGTPPRASNFPQRNRIISGISDVTVVAQASLSSGSLITAGFAAEQGRTLMAVPGNISTPLSIGCNKLIQDGAVPLVCIDDIFTVLEICPVKEKNRLSAELGADEKDVFNVIRKHGDVTTELISAETGKSIAEVNALVSILEIKGIVMTSMGRISKAM